MKAELKTIKDQNLNLSHKLQEKGGKKDYRQGNKRIKNKNSKDKFVNDWRLTNPSRTPKIFTGKWKWKSITPTSGEKQKLKDGKTYFWCPDHKAWGLHHPNDCEWRKERVKNDEELKASASTSTSG